MSTVFQAETSKIIAARPLQRRMKRAKLLPGNTERVPLRPQDPYHPGVRLAGRPCAEKAPENALQASIIEPGARQLLEHARHPRPRRFCRALS